MSFLSLTDADREQMLAAIGVSTVDELFRDIPEGVRYARELDIAPALTESELQRHMEELAGKNVVDEICFLGAGIYDHYVPAVVDAPETVNEDPYGDGWLIRIRMTSPEEREQLLDVAGYKKVLDEA